MGLKTLIKKYKERKRKKHKKKEEKLKYASQFQLIWHRFKKHKLALMALCVLTIFYLCAIFAEFVAPYGLIERNREYQHAPPTRVRMISEENGLRSPFIYGYEVKLDQETFQYEFHLDKSEEHSIGFFKETDPHELFGMITINRTLFGVEDSPVFLFGTDRLGRDIFSRVIYGSRVSLFIGLGGVFVSFVIGTVLGGIAGYLGGWLDELIMRLVDFLMSIPTLPLWIGLSAALPAHWGVIETYFAITLILALMGWTGLARVVRGKLISLREEEFALAAKAAGASERRIITKHLLPAFISYLVVHLTLAIPNMILGETALSFLGLGIQAPAVSWGSLLQAAQEITVLAYNPWLLFPALFVIVTILMYNFVGDGIRDAADPYSNV